MYVYVYNVNYITQKTIHPFTVSTSEVNGSLKNVGLVNLSMNLLRVITYFN